MRPSVESDTGAVGGREGVKLEERVHVPAPGPFLSPRALIKTRSPR